MNIMSRMRVVVITLIYIMTDIMSSRMKVVMITILFTWTAISCSLFTSSGSSALSMNQVL